MTLQLTVHKNSRGKKFFLFLAIAAHRSRDTGEMIYVFWTSRQLVKFQLWLLNV